MSRQENKDKPTMRIFILILIMSSLAGCFWESSPPDLDNKDQPIKLVVIWDQVISKGTIQRSSWLSTDKTQLTMLMQYLDSQSWESSTVLPACHSTRIILSMESGVVWEICQKTRKTKRLNMFDRNNIGRSGWINWSDGFLQKLTSIIESETGFSINLSIEYRKEISEGILLRVIPNSTQDLLNEFPGYPEFFWNKDRQRFQYTSG